VNRFTLHFAAFLGSASALALVLVAGISFACQSARAAMGGDKGSEMRFTPASRPQDGLSQAVNTPRPTGGKPVDLRRATREVAAGSPAGIRIEPSEPPTLRALVNQHTQAPRLVGLVNAGRDVGAMRPCHPSVTDRRDGRFAHSSSVSMGESGLSLPAHLRSTMVREPGPSEQGVRSVPGRAVPNEVVLLRDARGHFSQAFEDGAVGKDTRRRPEAAYLGESRHHGPKFGDGMERVDRRGVSLRPVSRVSREQERPAGIKPGRHLQTLATAAAHLCGVPVSIFHALIHRESSWRPWVVSSSGAVGLGQIKPSTLRDIDPRLNAWEPWDNLLGSACYLRQQFDRFGTWRKALHAYHGGPNRKATRQATHDYATDIIEASN